MNTSPSASATLSSSASVSSSSLASRFFATQANFGVTAARLALGIMILPHGAQKLLGWFGGYGFTGTMQFFTGTMGIPAVVAALAIFAEFFGGLALILGLGTRLAALAVGGVMAVAAFTVHLQNGFFMNWFGNQKGEGIEFFILAIGLAICLVIQGGGALSIDSKLGQRAK